MRGHLLRYLTMTAKLEYLLLRDRSAIASQSDVRLLAALSSRRLIVARALSTGISYLDNIFIKIAQPFIGTIARAISMMVDPVCPGPQLGFPQDLFPIAVSCNRGSAQALRSAETHGKPPRPDFALMQLR